MRRGSTTPLPNNSSDEPQHPQQQQRLYAAAPSRNEKLHQLAKLKRSPASPGPAAGSSTAKAKGVLLSTVLRQAPQHFDKIKVAAVERALTGIDELPAQYQSAEILYLSKNNLKSLEGVQQFRNLRILSAADNLLQDLDSLAALASCSNLQVASFERNPLTGLPNYRQKVLQLLPRLQNLDGRVVTTSERSKVQHVLQQEAAMHAVMLSNACMVHKLARSAELLQVHTELRRTMFGTSSVARVTRGVLPSYIPLDLLKFLKLWDYEGGLSAEERRLICDALTREVVRVHKQLQAAAATLKGPAQLPALQAWDTAFAKVMLAQQRTIIQLVELVNELHGEAATLVGKLTGQQPVTRAQQQQQQQQSADAGGGPDQHVTADQQMAAEREGLIIDLRDAALELAGLITAGQTAADAVAGDTVSLGSADTCASPQRGPLQRQQQRRLAGSPAAAPSPSRTKWQQQQQQATGGSSSNAGSPYKLRQQQQQATGGSSSNAGSPYSLRRRSSTQQDALRLRPSPMRGKAATAANAASPGKGPAAASRTTGTAVAGRAAASRMLLAVQPPATAALQQGGVAAREDSSTAEGDPLESQGEDDFEHLSQQQEQQEQQQQRVLIAQQLQRQSPPQQQHHHHRSPGRYDNIQHSQSPSPEPRGSSGGGAQQESGEGCSCSPAQSGSSPSSPTTRGRCLSPTARRLLLQAEQQHQRDLGTQQQWQQQGREEQQRQQLSECEPPDGGRCSLQQLLAGSESSSASGSPVTSAPLYAPAAAPQQQPRLASPHGSPSVAEAGSGSPAAAGQRYSATAPGPSPRGSSRGVGSPLHRSRGPLSAASSHGSSAHGGMEAHSRELHAWGSSSAPTQPTTANSSWQGGAPPPPLQPPHESFAGDDYGGCLAAQDSELGRSNPMQTPVGYAQGSEDHSATADPHELLQVGFTDVVYEQQEPRGIRRLAVGPGSASDPSSPAAAGVWQPAGPAGSEPAGTPQRSPAAAGSPAAAAASGSAVTGSRAWSSRSSPAGSVRAGSPLRNSVSAQQQQQQQQHQEQQHESSPVHEPAAAGQVFAQDHVPGTCMMMSPYVPAARQQSVASSWEAQPGQLPEHAQPVAVAEACAAPAGQAYPADAATAVVASPLAAASAAASAAAAACRPQLCVHPGFRSPSGAYCAASEAGALSELSGLSNPSPMSVHFGGNGPEPEPQQMHFNALFSADGERHSYLSEDDRSGLCSTPNSGGSVDGGVYQTRNIGQAWLGPPAAAAAAAAAAGVPQHGSPGAQGEISFAVQAQQGSPGSSLGEPGAWLTAAAAPGSAGTGRVFGLLGHLQQAHMQQPHQQQQLQPSERQQLQQPSQQLLWQLLQDAEEELQRDSPETDSNSAAAAAVEEARDPSHPSHPADAAAVVLEQQQAAHTGSCAVAVAPQALAAAAPLPAGEAGAAGNAATAEPTATAVYAPAATAAPAVYNAAAAAANQGASAAVQGWCPSSRTSLSSSVDLSPIKKQLFKSVSHSCHTLLQGAAGLSGIAAQLDCADVAAAGHGDRQAVHAGRAAHMEEQQRLQLQSRVAGDSRLSQQQQAQQQQQQPGLMATEAGSSPADTWVSWGTSSISPRVNEATAAAEVAITAADAAAQLSKPYPAGLLPMQSVAVPGEGGQHAAAAAGRRTGAGMAASTVAAAAPQQQRGVLMGLTPVVPGGVDRSAAAQAASDNSPAGDNEAASPRPERARGSEALAKALFGPPGAAPTSVQHRGPEVPAGTAGTAAVVPAAVAPPAVLAVPAEHAGVSQAPGSSLPASPAAAGAQSAVALLPQRPSSLPASPAAAAASVAVLQLPSSRGTLGPKSTAALAELQSQLLTMAVEKAALQRQLQQGRLAVDKLQEKACKSEQLEQVVQQMRSDLQRATQLLEHTGGAVQEQATLNEQLQQQVQQLQQQLWAAEAEQSKQATAGTLAKISLCRRVLRHFAAAAKTAAAWRQLKFTAQQQGQRRVLRWAVCAWRAAAQRTRAVAALQQRHRQRQVTAVLSAWAQEAREQRVCAAQQAAADLHWARHTSRRALVLWLLYTQQVRLLGVDLPSPSSSVSSALGSPTQQLPGLKLCAAAGAFDGPQRLLSGLTSRGLVTGLGQGGAALVRQRPQQQQQQQEAEQREEEQELSNASTPDKQHHARASRSAQQLVSGGLLALTQRLSVALPANSRAAAHNTADVMQGSSDPTPAAAGSAASNSLAAGKPWLPEGHAARNSAAAAAARGSRAAGSGGDVMMPLALQAGFIAACRAQKLRRRWLLVKAFKRWCQVVEAQAAKQRRLTAAQRHAARRLQRRAWRAWQHYQHYRQDKRQLAGRDGLQPEHSLLLQRHSKGQQQRLLLRVLAAWSSLCKAAALRRRMAQLLATRHQRHLQRHVLAALAQHAQTQHEKRCKQLQAEKHRLRVLLNTAWGAWRDSIGASHASAAWEAHNSQQLLARAVCRWHQLSASLRATAAAGAVEVRLAHMQQRRRLAATRAAFAAWRVAALQTAADGVYAATRAAQEQLQQLELLRLQDQQQLRQLPELLQQQAGLQQQLAAANVANLELQQVVEAQQQQMQQAAEEHQQQLAALQADHKLGMTVLQEQLQQACTNADDTAQQLQRLQQQHTQVQLEQQAKQQQLEQQVAQQKQDLEQQARHQLQRLDQQQQQWVQKQQQDQSLMDQLVSRQAQCQELATQLQRCTAKLNGQTDAVRALKAELTSTQQQLAAARSLSRNKSLALTEKAVAAEHGRIELEQQLSQERAASAQLQQQLAGLQRQLEQQRCEAGARRSALQAQQQAQVVQLQEQLLQKDEVICQLRDSMGAVQAQLAGQQAKVLSDVAQLRNGWSQAKQIIKQQRKTIKAQELMMSAGPEAVQGAQPPQLRPTQQPPPDAAVGSKSPAAIPAAVAAATFPITSFVLQQQQRQQQPVGP